MGPQGLGYGTGVLAAASFAKCPQVSAWEGSYTSLTQWPPSKLSHGQEAGCFSCLFCIQLLFFLFACTHLFSPNTTKYCFSLRFQLGSGMMCSWHALCERPSWGFLCEGAMLPAEFPFHAATRAPPFSFIQSLVCLWGGRCWPVIVAGVD